MKKNLLLYALCLLAATLFLAVMPTDAESAVYSDTVRLHILANSDSDEDQSLKLKVRDAVLDKFGAHISHIETAEDARDELAALIPDIESFCRQTVRNEGYSYPVSVSVGEEWYDTREYGSLSLPRGTYTSLRIIIGDGGGKNWWCVMFPPLCLDVATEKAPADDAVKKYTDEEFTLISKSGYNVKFKLLEIISSVFS